MFTITVEPFGQEYLCEDGESLLDAALRQRRLIRYGCKHGGCGTCKARLVAGDVDEPGSSFALTDEERAEDIILACASRPLESFGELKIRRSHRPVLMIAGGSGLAPLLSMLRGLAAEELGRDR
ncbi:MAG: 2Fe-2S iron-sulfur cluster binding domain-containing protein [Propionibacteriales bacterium]|nr:2Fe-2S iron-sulfur cluster binding domain-containing protein [Propionibacteriales bacterium]